MFSVHKFYIIIKPLIFILPQTVWALEVVQYYKALINAIAICF